MANKESDLIFEAYVSMNEKVRSLKGFEGEEDDRISSFMKLQKAKEEMPKIKEEPETKEEDDLGLGPNTPSMIRITSIGSTTPFKRKTEAPIEDEAVYIQAGEKEDCG